MAVTVTTIIIKLTLLLRLHGNLISCKHYRNIQLLPLDIVSLKDYLIIVILNWFCHLRDDESATEVAWVVVYLSALSNLATSMLVKNDVLQLLLNRLATSNSLQLMIPVMISRTFG